MQQIEACHNIVGIPQEFTIDLTGQTNPTRRAGLWKHKRVFFVTPQVLEKDISSGSCLVKQLVCLVIDEAHRATGNYSYCVAVRQLMAVPVQLRILALSATPGSKQQTIQNVIDNLQVSTLEYRDESDHDVAPYVHERTIELIQVEMGKDAVEINDLLVAVISPYVSRLGKHGVIQNRDVQTWSPHALLISRENYRQFKAENMPDTKKIEIEGVFGVLITLYHVRKLLSSHGIKPAFEMLEEKFHQGSFVRFVSRNESLIKAKLLMQQSVTHGAPSPKLSKMLDILLDHFKNNDSQSSRVIIFSNFRGSVREIMNTLAKVGDPVRATEFIGQSAAKTLKGQTQKIQQAVLEKFRSGKFNVIVATSIGEEGLDIMEVDLVICFDANISPLRMIQRMGRTGRKHEGRVVVLACKGSELNGYLRKKSKNNTIKKHMRNGGLNSFVFHSSPRMIPHVIKPEVQLVELSIKQFIHRGKKVQADQLMHSPAPLTNLTNAETEQIAKYFSCMEENLWRPSLIAFPLFQSYPSRVHNVLHSSRTGMLIDAMQHLQESSLFRGKDIVCEDGSSSNPCAGEAVSQDDMKGSQTFSELLPEKEAPEGNTSPMDTEPKLEPHGRCVKSPKVLFGSEFKSIEKVRRPQNLYVSKLLSHSSNNEISEIRCASTSKSCPDEKVFTCGLHNPDLHLEASSQSERIHLVPLSCNKSVEVDRTDGSPLSVSEGTHAVDDESNDCNYADISPRLTSFIKSGYVPESPINDFDISKSQDCASTSKLLTKLVNKLPLEGEYTKSYTCPTENISVDTVDQIERTVVDANNNLPQRCKSATSLDEPKTPMGQLSNFSSSNDWKLNSGEHFNSIEQPCKFRRLRKHGDHRKKLSLEKRGNTKTYRMLPGCDNQFRGDKKREKDCSVFIDEEAEVFPHVLDVGDDEACPAYLITRFIVS
ncbi:hypothetical protein Leryth_013378 [Lithospermum erythrorhizon]|nr:hypothetical protein Leryth_013378 [Lithospermum erythrorhizon]